MIKAIYELDMTPRRTLPIIINVSQYDDIGRTLVFNLFSSSGKWTAPTSAAVTFEGGKPDGKFFSYNCAYSNGTVTVAIQQQMTAVAGKVRCKIKVTSGDKVVESAPIIMVVDAAAVPDGSDMSKTDINDAIANATQKIVDQVKDNIPSDYSQLSTDISSLKQDIDNVAINGIYQHNYVLSWEQGKFKYESGLIFYGDENYAIHSNFINISEINKPINIYVPDGIQIFALCFDNNNGTYTKAFPVCTWTPGKTTVTFTKTDILAKYIILMATRTSNGVIVPGDASRVSVYISSSTKTQTDVDNLYASFLSHAKRIDDTNEKGTYIVNINNVGWEQGNFSYNSGNFSYSDHLYIIRSSFVDISTFDLSYPIYIYVPDALQISVWASDKNDGTYTILKQTTIWKSGMFEISGLTQDVNYLICKVRTAPDGKGLIVPADAKDIKFYGSRETKAYNTAKESRAFAKGAMNVANEGLSLTTRQLSIKNLPKKNLLNVDGAVHGYYLNNKFNATGANNAWMAAVIDVNQYKTITLSGFPDKGGAYTAFLHGNSIEKWSMNAWNTKDNNGTHVIPDKYRFIGICWNAQSENNQLQVEYGESATDFEAYELVKKSETIEYLNLHMSGNDAYIGKYLESVKAQPMYFAIIDDDTNTQKSVKKFYDICVANNVVGGYAVEARHLELDENIIAMLKEYENDGFGCYLHCYNQAAQTPSGINCWDTINRTNAECLKYAEKDFNKGLRLLNSWGFLDAQSVWVVPGGVPDTESSREWVTSMSQKRGFRYAVNADPKQYITTECNALNNRYNIPRFGLTNNVDDGNTEKLKQYIDRCVTLGASIIIMTHTGMWKDNDEEALTNRFGEVIQYAKSNGLKNVNPLELMEKKYPLYLYNEMR